MEEWFHVKHDRMVELLGMALSVPPLPYQLL